MNKSQKLGNAPRSVRSGHSWFGIASVCLAIANLLFVLVCGPLDASPFQSLGNEKECWVSCIAAALGMLLTVRALSDPVRRKTLGIVGLCLNVFALAAASVLLPYI